MKTKAKTNTKAKGKAVTKPGKKHRQKKIMIAAFAVGAAGILGYFGWQYLKKRKEQKSGDLDEVLKTTIIPDPSNNDLLTPNIPKPVAKPSAGSKTRASATSEFPLKKGSKGELVRQLQDTLITKYGKSILPKYGADGDFGTETVNALKKVGLPVSVSQSTFNVLVQGTGSVMDGATLGKELYAAASAKDFSKAMAVLKKMKGTDDYSVANEIFKASPLGVVRQTIVNGLLNTFTNESQKQQIRFEFLRMGLEYDGNKWSLSGLNGFPIITIVPTTVWINPVKGVKVPPRMVLGNEVCKRMDYTVFQNRGKYFLVQSKCVSPLQ
jgi:hypothetical protein